MTDDATPRTSAPQDQYSRINPFPETTILGPALQQDLVQAIQDFYRVSDDPAANDAWLGYFTPNAKAIMAGAGAQGTDALRRFRATMWKDVKARSHRASSAYVGAVTEGRVQLMLEGVVARVAPDERETVLSWAARAVWERHDGAWKMAFYQVWLSEKTGLEWVPDEA
ncbi:hypothetical protein VD0002_g10255 [Verticillium dahliae]|uniref:SnoaL-like domain-containing protein n=2 Tax=Verticillium dahliae TaxID=27337 RepID=G2X7S5_VERDV|nr:uncharacterized protein VDAG_06533 [Verticillium dahliae VdLs.17]KAF3347655.1 Guanine nucleotide-binding protein subunit gamma [Verticillium dahliae VDG2]KAH6694494.1 hypothetical protein EV126DRAFT_427972 [Verticillium dahliae]EGY15043.1 hypothetical protein VDAG_06533 [Verticillium dahliae VdLs.17]PNH27562.1 hypothetical protein BJF96_g9185 [Verticillium dahliae]PNH48891.1 hypothetical protein VD0003_g8234 [Verticillium dahliae]